MTYLTQYTSLVDRNRRARTRSSVRAASISSNGSRPNSRPTSGADDGNLSSASRSGVRKRGKRREEEQNILNFDQQSCILSTKEAKSTYVVLIIVLHFILLSIPIFTTSVAWTLTNVIHSVTMYFVLHHCKGSPFSRHDQGKFRRYTYWEQLDNDGSGEFSWSRTRKFFLIAPIVLFVVAQFYSMFWHSAINGVALLVAIVPKLPQFHKFRFLGINRY
jgi:hypothetical protein